MASVPLHSDNASCNLESGVEDEQVSSHRVQVGDEQSEAALFSGEFLSVDMHRIVRDLKEKGYYAFLSAIPQLVLKTIERNATQLNANENRAK